MTDRTVVIDWGIKNWEYFQELPELNRTRLNLNSVKGTQFAQPLFEFSSACAGCGETPYLKLLTQMFGDRMVVANATGCSSIYGANLPTTPWATNAEGKGPAWANSLFEDNAEFGLGIRIALNQKQASAMRLLEGLKNSLCDGLADEILNASQKTEEEFGAQQARIEKLNAELVKLNSTEAKRLLILSENLLNKTVWIVGGDGWAYDIGYGGLDHILSTGENVNILVMDTEVYSNTGGQTSKATPLGAIAKFSAAGKRSQKKNLGQIAISNRNVYVAQIAMGANDTQTVRAIREAQDFNGPSLLIAYSHCIAHGYDMAKGAEQQEKAVKSGYWPLFRFNPDALPGKRFTLDSKDPTIELKDYMYNEGRFTQLLREHPDTADELLNEAQKRVIEKFESLKTLSIL